MRHPQNTVERAFELASDVEKQLQVTDSFKLDFPHTPPENSTKWVQKKHLEMNRK